MTDDVKELLGRAFGDEPPLRIDREVVLEQGRKRLRRKRFIDTGSVVAAVVVAVVGATTLTNLADREPERLPPAASETRPAPQGPAPQGPELPLTTTTKTELPETPASTNDRIAPPSTISTTEADQLTTLLYATGVVSPDTVRPVSGRPVTPQFVPLQDRYVYEANVIGPTAKGFLQVTVGYTPDITQTCTSGTPTGKGDCIVKKKDGVSVTVVHSTSADGERRVTATAKFRSGVRIAVMASNTTFEASKAGDSPSDTAPVLSDDQVCALVTKVGLNA